MTDEKNKQWTSLQKIAFRFFFVFLILQFVFSEGLFIVSFAYTPGNAMFIFRITEKIFIKPCLWFNNHLFHFKYHPTSWTAFSPSLQTIRSIVYLLMAVLTCFVWTIVDRRRMNYNKMLYWFSRCMIIILSCIMFSYAIVKVFPVQMSQPSFTDLHTPIGDLSPFELIWTTFGYGKPYQVFCGFFELTGAVLILFNRTRIAGLFLLLIVMINVILLNYTYQIGVLIFSFYLLLVILFLLAPYTRQFLLFFFTDKPVERLQNKYIPDKGFKLKSVKRIVAILIGCFFLSHILAAYNRYTKAEHINNSTHYSLIKNYIVNNDTLKLVENDDRCWRVWSEGLSDGKRIVTISTMKSGADKNYRVEQDSLRHTLSLQPVSQNDTTSLKFNYTNIDSVDWRLEGIIKQDNIKVELQKINPDTIMNLLKVKRTIITFDDKPDEE